MVIEHDKVTETVLYRFEIFALINEELMNERNEEVGE